jgi:redox-regulated HSP33 family molecular chaperone
MRLFIVELCGDESDAIDQLNAKSASGLFVQFLPTKPDDEGWTKVLLRTNSYADHQHYFPKFGLRVLSTQEYYE